MSHILKRKRFMIIMAAIMLFVMVTGASAQSVETVQGLVFLDDNQNGVWDVGEAGYGGEMQTVTEDDGWMHDRYVGATVTALTPAYDEYELESAGYRELSEDETFLCDHQDSFVDDDVVNENPLRPCTGAWGLPGMPEDIQLQVWVTAPDGYVVTSENPQYFTTGEDSGTLDFGIAPADSVTVEEETDSSDEESEENTTSYTYAPEGTGFVAGLVFIDDNENGVWEINEAGYGGQLQTVEEDDGWMHNRYVGAALTLISPAYDEVNVESAPYQTPDEDENDLCTQQDYLDEDDELSNNPLRPCVGTWGITNAGDDVRWEVQLSVPEGYRLTTEGSQFYTTGSGDPLVDFGIVPVDGE